MRCKRKRKNICVWIDQCFDDSDFSPMIDNDNDSVLLSLSYDNDSINYHYQSLSMIIS